MQEFGMISLDATRCICPQCSPKRLTSINPREADEHQKEKAEIKRLHEEKKLTVIMDMIHSFQNQSRD
jgi:hypothetical protein